MTFMFINVVLPYAAYFFKGYI